MNQEQITKVLGVSLAVVSTAFVGVVLKNLSLRKKCRESEAKFESASAEYTKSVLSSISEQSKSTKK